MSDALLNLLDPSEVIAYRPALARALGSINAALFLCQAVYWHRIAKKMGNESFFKLMECEKDEDGNLLPPSSSHKQSWQWELGGMTRRQQEAARKILSDLNILYGIVRGTPAKLFYTINDAELEKFIIKNQQFGGNVQTGLDKNANLDVRKKTNKFGENAPSITEITPQNTTQNIANIQPTHTCVDLNKRAKAICQQLIALKISNVSANDQNFLKLLLASNWDEEFVNVAQACAPGQMQFNYILAKIQGRRDDAEKIMATLKKAP